MEKTEKKGMVSEYHIDRFAEDDRTIFFIVRDGSVPVVAGMLSLLKAAEEGKWDEEFTVPMGEDAILENVMKIKQVEGVINLVDPRIPEIEMVLPPWTTLTLENIYYLVRDIRKFVRESLTIKRVGMPIAIPPNSKKIKS